METAELSVSRPTPDALQIRLAGPWLMETGRPPVDSVEQALAAEPPPRQVSFDTAQLKAWDSGLLTFLSRVVEHCTEHGIAIDRAGLPVGVRRLLDLAEKVPERKGARSEERRPWFVARIGAATLN